MGNAQGVEGVMFGGGTSGAEDDSWGWSCGVDLVAVDGDLTVWVRRGGRRSGVFVKRRALIGVRLESLGMVGRAEKLPAVGNIK